MSIKACGRDEIGEVGRVLYKDLPVGGNFRSCKEKPWRETIDFPNSDFFDIRTLSM